MEIGIIGGTNGLGKSLACYLKRDNFNVTVTGRNQKRGSDVSNKLGVKYSEIASYIKDENSVNKEVREKIERLHKNNLHKFNIPTYRRDN